jgi:hypothetical protein
LLTIIKARREMSAPLRAAAADGALHTRDEPVGERERRRRNERKTAAP